MGAVGKLDAAAGEPTGSFPGIVKKATANRICAIKAMLLTFPVFVYNSDAVMWSQLIFSLLGLAIFLIPLISLRERLVEARADKLAWIRRRHSRVIESIESCGDGPLDARLVNELMAVDTIRNDIQHISGWPFNTGVIVRLITVVVVPLSLILVANYLIHIMSL